MTTLEVLAPGPLALIVDEGRPGLAAIGVSPSGAFDRPAYRLANRLVGNQPGAAALEVTLGGLRLRATSDVLLVLTGADAAATVLGRGASWARPLASGSTTYLRAGDELRLGLPRTGLRSYLAVHGGFDAPRTLGSAATDLLSGLGPAPLRAGDVLSIGSAPATGFPGVDHVPPAEAADLVLGAVAGPRDDWFDLDDLSARPWTVSPASSRIGVRLDGEPLVRRPGMVGRELPSEPAVRGAIQVPPTGQPLIFGPDHPVTGGYPVIAVLTAAATDRLAQARPGQAVRIVFCRR